MQKLLPDQSTEELGLKHKVEARHYEEKRLPDQSTEELGLKRYPIITDFPETPVFQTNPLKN